MKSILFKEELFNKVIERKKRQTRRIIQDLNPNAELQEIQYSNNERNTFLFKQPDKKKLFPYWPKYKKGDLVYLKEPYAICNYEEGEKIEYKYKPSSVIEEGDYKWENKLFMKEMYARYFIKITDVFVEKLNDITEEDALSEGMEKYGPFGEYKGSIHPNGGCMRYRAFESAKSAFLDIWDSIYSAWEPKLIEVDGVKQKHYFSYPSIKHEAPTQIPRSAELDRTHIVANPWVVKISFELMSKNEVYIKIFEVILTIGKIWLAALSEDNIQGIVDDSMVLKDFTNNKILSHRRLSDEEMKNGNVHFEDTLDHYFKFPEDSDIDPTKEEASFEQILILIEYAEGIISFSEEYTGG